MANELLCLNCGKGFIPTCYITRQKFSSSECRVRYNNAKRYYTDTPVNECPEYGTPIQQSGEAGRWRQCEKEEACVPMKKSTVPPALLPGGGSVSASLLAQIMHSKYVLALPLYRQEQELHRLGLPVSRQTMSNWVLTAGERWLLPVYHVLHKELLANKILHADETTLMVLREPERQALADELGEDGIRELAQRYAEAYEGCYDGEEMDAYIEEICADAYAGMDRLPEAKARIIQKAAKRAQETQQAAEENGGTRGPPEKYSVNKGFSEDVAEWYRDGMTEGESFTLGYTGETLQGLGAIESDIYMNGDKISTILKEHPEMTIREIQKIPELLDDPILILKSKGSGNGGNSRLVLFGSINTQGGQPVLAVLDLRPRENGFVLDDMQKVNSAYAKANPASFVSQSDVLFADKKRTVPLLRRFGLTVTSRELLRDGSIGSISYRGNSVNISGEKFSSIVQMGDRPMDAKFSADDTTATPQENDKAALPEVSNAPSVSQFRYSVAEDAQEAGGTTAFTLDSIPKKAQDYLCRVCGQTAAAIQRTLSMPFAARQEVLKPAIEEMMNEYLQTGRISQETVDRNFEESYRRGVKRPTVRVRWEFSDAP